MSTTLRTRTTLPTHSAGWQALRIVTDRAGKWTKEEPRGRHRLAFEDEVQALVDKLCR